MFFRIVPLAFWCWVFGLCPARAEQVPVWTTGTGTAVIVFQHGLLASLGFTVAGVTNGPLHTGLTEASAIKFVSPWGSPDSFLGGSLKCGRGFTLEWPEEGATNRAVMEPLELFALKDTDVFELRDEDSLPVFTMDRFDVRFDPGQHQLLMRRGSLRLDGQFADRVGRPELAGIAVGVVDCEVEIHELEQRINRRAKPQPPLCAIPPGPRAGVRIRAIEGVQATGPATNGLIPAAIALSLENPGPDALPLSAAAALPLTFRILAMENGATQSVVESVQTIRLDPAEKCPCADASLLYPGLVAHWTPADAISAGAALQLPVAVLGREGVSFFVEADLSGASVRRPLTVRRKGDAWLFGL